MHVDPRVYQVLGCLSFQPGHGAPVLLLCRGCAAENPKLSLDAARQNSVAALLVPRHRGDRSRTPTEDSSAREKDLRRLLKLAEAAWWRPKAAARFRLFSSTEGSIAEPTAYAAELETPIRTVGVVCTTQGKTGQPLSRLIYPLAVMSHPLFFEFRRVLCRWEPTPTPPAQSTAAIEPRWTKRPVDCYDSAPVVWRVGLGFM